MASHHDLVVIGASAGGLPALVTVLESLPAELPMTVLVVVHSSPDRPSGLVDVLNRRSNYPVAYARDGVKIAQGHVYVAPPDFHLTTEDGHLAVRRGPRENRFRPAVDPLFRSAAESHGERVIAIVLSGYLHDGTHGLAAVKRHGGVAIVQSEADALVPEMPASAASAVAVDYVIAASEMAHVIAGLVGKPKHAPSRKRRRTSGKMIGVRSRASAKDPPPPADPRRDPTVFTCPDCGGALWELEDAAVLRYRCHIGHGINSDGLARAQVENIEESLSRAIRALGEHAELRRRMALRAHAGGLVALASGWEAEAEESMRRGDEIRALLQDGIPGSKPRDARGLQVREAGERE